MKKLLVLFLLIVTFAYYSNNALEITEYSMTHSNWPKSLDGYRIVHLSDLHNKSFGRNQKHLLEKIDVLDPDLIIMTGDLIDRHHYDKEPALQLMEGCIDLAPTAYVTGNHEIWHGSSDSLMTELRSMGVIVLNNETIHFTTSNGSYMLTGIGDRADFMEQVDYDSMLDELSKTSKNPSEIQGSDFNILLSHRPEQFESYVYSKYDLVFSGHSHGGQFRLPFLGGLIAPNQGLLPKYDGGFFQENDTTMIVSRGLGNSIMPLRLFNQPEIPVLTLRSR
jgi:hypothetical protein